MEKFFIGFVVVVGLTLTGCSRQSERNATDNTSKVDVDEDDRSSSKIGGDNVERATGTEDHKAVSHFEAGIAAYEANDLPLANFEGIREYHREKLAFPIACPRGSANPICNGSICRCSRSLSHGIAFARVSHAVLFVEHLFTVMD